MDQRVRLVDPMCRNHREISRFLSSTTRDRKRTTLGRTPGRLVFRFVLILRSGDTQEVSIMLFAYVGPETMLPLASILAGVVGVLLMFGRNVMMFGRKVVRGIRGLKGRR